MTQAAILAASGSPGTTTGFKNKLINGNMAIFQRATSVTASNYFVDRWQYLASQSSKGTANQSSTAPTGFSFSSIFTSSSAYSVGASDYFVIDQSIEGFNTADLAWGTANAKTVTLSFWVQSSLTGTFGGAFRNAAGNRNYPFSYTISAANTWEYKTVTVAGDTTGTWVGATNGVGVDVSFGLGAGSSFSGTAGAWGTGNLVTCTGATSVVGTSGATFYITGVQLEVGTTATNFDFRSYTNELQLCQRYYYYYTSSSENPVSNCCYYNTVSVYTVIQMPVTMRSAPTLSATSGTSYYKVYRNGTANYFNTLSLDHSNINNVDLTNVESLSGTSGWAGWIRTHNVNSYIAFNAEL